MRLLHKNMSCGVETGNEVGYGWVVHICTIAKTMGYGGFQFCSNYCEFCKYLHNNSQAVRVIL